MGFSNNDPKPKDQKEATIREGGTAEGLPCDRGLRATSGAASVDKGGGGGLIRYGLPRPTNTPVRTVFLRILLFAGHWGLGVPRQPFVDHLPLR